jgi:hypothetical protein
MKNKIILLVYIFTSQIAIAQSLTVLPTGFTPVQPGAYPRLTNAAILALPSPQPEDIAYDLTYNCVRVYNGSKWISLMQNNTGPSGSGTSAGGTQFEEAYSVAKDSQDNLFVTGFFQGTATFGTITKTAIGLSDIFIAKYSAAGNCLWVKTEGSFDTDIGQDIKVDFQGNAYVTGNIGKYMFTAKYNAAGVQQWLQYAGGGLLNGSSGMALEVDTGGNVYAVGNFDETFTFISGSTLSPFSPGISDIIILKYDTNGNPQWGKTAGGPGTDTALDVALYTFFGGNGLKITGYISSSGAQFNNGGTVINAINGEDSFICSYNTNGTFFSAANIGGFTNDRAWGVATLGFDTYVVGERNSQFYISKINSSNTIDWTQQSTGIGVCRGLDIQQFIGELLVTGTFQNGTYFNGTFLYNNGSSDIFVAKYSLSGTLNDIKTYGGPGIDVAQGIVGTSFSTQSVVGSFSNTITVGNSIKTSLGGKDILIANLEN